MKDTNLNGIRLSLSSSLNMSASQPILDTLTTSTQIKLVLITTEFAKVSKIFNSLSKNINALRNLDFRDLKMETIRSDTRSMTHRPQKLDFSLNFLGVKILSVFYAKNKLGEHNV